MQMALRSCSGVYGGNNRDTVHVNNQPSMFWSRLEKGDAFGVGDLCGRTCHNFFSFECCKTFTGHAMAYFM